MFSCECVWVRKERRKISRKSFPSSFWCFFFISNNTFYHLFFQGIKAWLVFENENESIPNENRGRKVMRKEFSVWKLRQHKQSCLKKICSSFKNDFLFFNLRFWLNNQKLFHPCLFQLRSRHLFMLTILTHIIIYAHVFFSS